MGDTSKKGGRWLWVANLVFEHVHGIIWIDGGGHDIIYNDVNHEVPDIRRLPGRKDRRV